jgi:uncharacterized peroxidase-related enzyme
MAHIKLPDGEPGIMGIMVQHREAEKPLNELCNTIMCGPSSLTTAEREMIATYVSSGNECRFCTATHAAATRVLFGEKAAAVDRVLRDLETAGIDEKLKSLLIIAGKVRQDGRLVTSEDVARARAAGADDKAIHDTVLIAAMFCMFNRYVDGLGTHPGNEDYYAAAGIRIANRGYGSRFKST